MKKNHPKTMQHLGVVPELLQHWWLLLPKAMVIQPGPPFLGKPSKRDLGLEWSWDFNRFHVISGYHNLNHHFLLLFRSIWPAFCLDIQRPKLREFFMNPSHSPPTCQRSHRKKTVHGKSIACIPIQSVYPVMFDGWLPYISYMLLVKANDWLQNR